MLLDILVILLILAGVAFGFWRGVLVQGLAILGIYLGALLARFIYEPLAEWLNSVTGFNVVIAQALMFLLILLVVPALLIYLVYTFWGTLKLPQRWGQVDLLGGSLLGLVVGLLLAMFAVLAFGFMVTTTHLNGPQGLQYPLADQFRSAWTNSLLRAPIVEIGRIFYYALLPNAGKTVPDILQVFSPR